MLKYLVFYGCTTEFEEVNSLRLSLKNTLMKHMELDAGHVPLSVLSQDVTNLQACSFV